MLADLKNFLVTWTGSDPKEIEIIYFQVGYIALSFLFRKIPGNWIIWDSKQLGTRICARKFLYSLVGLISFYILLRFKEFLLINVFFICYYYLDRLYAVNNQKKMRFVFFAFILHAIVCLYVFVEFYGVYYPTHLSMITMMLVPKLIYFTWEQHFSLNPQAHPNGRSLLDLLMYLYCYPGCIVGPVMSFREYIYFISGRSEFRYSPTTSDYLSNLLSNLFTLFCIVYIPRLIDFSLILSAEFRTSSALYQIFYSYTYFFFCRCRLVFAFSLSHLRNLVLGISGVNPTSQTESELDSYVKSVNYFTVESSCVFRTKLNNWNYSISKWLRDCFYFRFIHILSLSKDSSAMIVFFLSAMWHGFYPSYYLGFLFFNLTLIIERSFYKLRERVSFYPALRVLMGFLTILIGAPGMIFYHTVWTQTKVVFRNVLWIILFKIAVFIFSKLLLILYKPKK